MKTRTAVVLEIAISTLLMASCSELSSVAGGPPDSQIKEDALVKLRPCVASKNPKTTIDGVKISEKKVENNQATVFVGVEYHSERENGYVECIYVSTVYAV